MLENIYKSLIWVGFFCLFGGHFCLAGDQIDLDLISKPSGIEINWDKNRLNDLESVILIKKVGGCPANIYDGQEVYRGNGNSFFDKETENNTIYCYAFTTSDTLGNISEILAVKQIEKKGAGEYYLRLVQLNYILVVGPFIILILWLVDRATRCRDL